MDLETTNQGTIQPGTDVVTGAFGYIGRYLTQRLLAAGRNVVTLTGRPDPSSPFSERVRAHPFNFDNPAALAESLRGAETLYNTYWVRFAHGHISHERAVENSRVLIRAAETAGIRRIVHVSITNPSPDSLLPYFRGKALVEESIKASGLSYAVLRPTVVFGNEDILVNNIAWLLRRFPVFLVPGTGEYRIQPIFVEDVVGLMMEAGRGSGRTVSDAVGPEVLTFNEMVKHLRRHTGSRARILHAPPAIPLLMSNTLGFFLGDVVLTREEVDSLAANLLVSSGPPTAPTRFTEWLSRPGVRLGLRYSSEMERHYRRA